MNIYFQKKFKNTTESYILREIDNRMINIINTHIQKCDVLADMGCGSGLYGEYLKDRCNTLYGIDYDPKLVELIDSNPNYDRSACLDILNIKNFDKKFDYIFCSEVLEHFNKDDFPIAKTNLEMICNDTLVITVPNPLSPHFYRDPTHINKYNIYSFLKVLNQSKTFKYEMHALGFSEDHLKSSIIFKILNIFSSRIPILSPTLLYIGKKK